MIRDESHFDVYDGAESASRWCMRTRAIALAPVNQTRFLTHLVKGRKKEPCIVEAEAVCCCHSGLQPDQIVAKHQNSLFRRQTVTCQPLKSV